MKKINSNFYPLILFIGLLSIQSRVAFAKVCVHIASYDEKHNSSSKINAALVEKLKGHCELITFYMDSKNNQDREFIKNKGIEAKQLIDSKKADVVVLSDDNAVTDVLLAHYQNSTLPFVFCGINWSIDRYNLPFKNTTGMIEVDHLDQIVQEMMRSYKNIKTIVKVSPATETDVITAKAANKIYGRYGIEFKNIFVKNYEEWKKGYLDAQNTADAVHLSGPAGIKEWNHSDADQFVEKNMKKPTFSTSTLTHKYTVFSIAKRTAEQGEWSAEAAIKILKGAKPDSIAVVTNKEFTTYINPRFQKKFPIKFSELALKKAIKTDGSDLK